MVAMPADLPEFWEILIKPHYILCHHFEPVIGKAAFEGLRTAVSV
jgi:hypothetical protein